jgi:lycopene cyclase domain-containing protein
MGVQKLIYLIILVLFILIPAGISLKRNDRYLHKLKYLFPAILFTGAIFIIWDIRFVELGIWNFNPDYITGILIRNLPVEEWIMFFAIPFLGVYVYEFLKSLTIRTNQPNLFVVISLVLLTVFGIITFIFRKNIYPFFTFFLLTIYFGYTIFRNNFKKNYPAFYISLLIMLLPFLILRGIITSLPVITFNSEHILNIHIFTIPIEDLGYFFLLHLMNITIFEYLRERQFY